MIWMHYVIRESSQGHVADCGIPHKTQQHTKYTFCYYQIKRWRRTWACISIKAAAPCFSEKALHAMHSLSRTSGGLNSPERAVRRRRWKSFIVLGCVPFSSAHKRAGRGDKKRNSGNTRGELLPKSCSLASRCQAKTLVVSSRNPTAALRVLESDRPPGHRLKASHYVCVCLGWFFLPLFCCRKKKDSSHDCARAPHHCRILCECLCLQCGHLVCVSLQRSAIFGLGCLRHYAHIHVRTGCRGYTSTDNHFACAPHCGCLARTHAATVRASNCRRKMSCALTCTNAGKRR
jgi:hypothetical protein